MPVDHFIRKPGVNSRPDVVYAEIYQPATRKVDVRLRGSAVLLVVVLLVSGCGTFSHEKTPPLTTSAEHAQFGGRPSIHLSVKLSTKKAGTTKLLSDERGTDDLKKLAAKVTENSNLFGHYSLEHPVAIVPDYLIEMELIHDFSNDSWTSLPLAFWQGASEGALWIIPFPATIRQTLTTKITDNKGRLSKTYISIDGVTAWISIWSLAFAKEQMETVVHENWERLIGSTYRMMVNDSLFRQDTLQEYN